jgi:hypothetical protein
MRSFKSMIVGAAVLAGVVTAAPAVAQCASPQPFLINYQVNALEYEVRSIAMFQGVQGCYGGITNSFFASPGPSLITDPFTKTNRIESTFMLGVATDINDGEDGQDHLVIFGNTNWASGAQNIAFGTLFPQVLEANVIGALLAIGGATTDPDELNAAVTTLFDFYDYQFGAPGGSVAFAMGDAFSIVAFSDGRLIGDGISFATPVGPAVPEPASWAMLIAGFGLVGAAQRRRLAAVSA